MAGCFAVLQSQVHVSDSWPVDDLLMQHGVIQAVSASDPISSPANYGCKQSDNAVCPIVFLSLT